MKLKKIINRLLCEHKNIYPVRCVDTFESIYKNGKLNEKSSHNMTFTITYICKDCRKHIDIKNNLGRKYYN